MADPVKKDDALAAAVREAFQRHMENARLASQVKKPTPLANDPRLQSHRLLAAVPLPEAAPPADAGAGGEAEAGSAPAASVETRTIEHEPVAETMPSLPRAD